MGQPEELGILDSRFIYRRNIICTNNHTLVRQYTGIIDFVVTSFIKF